MTWAKSIGYFALRRFFVLLLVFGIIFMIFAYLIPNIFSNNQIPFYQFISTILATLGTVCLTTAIIHFFRTSAYLYYSRNRPTLTQNLPKVKNEVKILGISLFEFHTNQAITNCLVHFLTSNTKSIIHIKLLLMDPNSKFLNQQEIEEDGNNTKSRLTEECCNTLTQLSNIDALLKNTHHIFEYRVFDFMPKHGLAIYDNNVHFCPYLFSQRGIESKWMEIFDADMRRQFNCEFEALWSHSKEWEWNDDENKNPCKRLGLSK